MTDSSLDLLERIIRLDLSILPTVYETRVQFTRLNSLTLPLLSDFGFKVPVTGDRHDVGERGAVVPCRPLIQAEPAMEYLHTMVRVSNLEQSLHFYCDLLGLQEISRQDSEQGRFTLVFLAAPGDVERARDNKTPLLELTYNWDPETYTGGRNFGHLAYRVDDIYATCQRLQDGGVTINRPPRDGHMAFVRSPENISIELLQKNGSLPPAEPWVSMPNTGVW
jgi:lactoylglutathione lyase